jgi:hypothetical protein
VGIRWKLLRYAPLAQRSAGSYPVSLFHSRDSAVKPVESAAKPVEPAAKPSVREALLREEFAHQYAGIEPGVWFNAAGLAEQLIAQLLRDGVPDDELPRRVLDPRHFEFRGGEPSAARTASGRIG